MTGQAERIKEAHRGWRQAEPASRSRIASLEYHGLRYSLIDDATAVVESEYIFNLKGSHWRSEVTGSQGYTVIALVQEIGSRSIAAPSVASVIDNFIGHLEKPAAGRDSIANPADPDRTAELTIDSGCDAESVAGPIPSLPEVNQWP